MELPGRLTSALHALTAAVGRLEAAVARQGTQAGERNEREDELFTLRDRCAELVNARTGDSLRIAELLRANDDVGGRLEQVAVALKAIAARHENAASAKSD